MDAPLPEARPRARMFRSWETWVVFGLSLLLTGMAWWLLNDQIDRQADARFRARARDLTTEIASRMDTYEQVMRGAVALVDVAGGRVSRTEWRTYVAGLNVEDRYPGIQGIGYAKRVKAADLALHEAAVRAEGYYTYRVTPDNPRPEYFPIVYLEPFASRNLRAFGYDMHAEPVRRAAMERARDLGTAAATSKVKLVQETEEDVQAGFLIYLPVYDRMHQLETPGDRHEALTGFVYSPFRMNDLMRPIMKDGIAEDLDVEIYDGPAVAPDALLFEKESHHRPRFEETRRIDVFGRTWTLRITSSPGFEAGTGSPMPQAVLVAGAIIAMLLVAIINSVLQDRHRMAELRRSYGALAKARAEAEEANAAKSRFLAAASHDLRQPLQTLGIYLHMIGEQAEAPFLRKLADSARDAFEATQRMLNSLMDIAMLEAGVTRPQLAAVELAPFLARISEDLRVEAEAKGLSFRVSSCDVRVTTDPAMLERIVRNLLSNALKYTRTGVIRLACRASQRGIAIKIQDTGPGIPRDRMHLIFEDFYQIDNPERDRRKGLGLGLATVARLTRLLGYRLRVLSRPGRGAIFIVEIPTDAATTGGEADRSAQPSPDSSGRSASNTAAM